MFNVDGKHILAVTHDTERGPLEVTAETDADVGGCLGYGVVAAGHGRRDHLAARGRKVPGSARTESGRTPALPTIV